MQKTLCRCGSGMVLESVEGFKFYRCPVCGDAVEQKLAKERAARRGRTDRAA